MTVRRYKVGPGTLKINAARSASITTTSTDTTITAAGPTFAAGDVGSTIVGTGIPGGATIASVTSATEAELSAAATASGTITATITPAGGEADFSCQVTSAVVSWSDEEGDPLAVLCGDEEPGDMTWAATLSGTMVQDPGAGVDLGLVAWTWEHKGEKVPAVFTPSNAAARQVVGTLVVKPLDFGGEVKQTPTSDFEWPYVGEPVLQAVPV